MGGISTKPPATVETALSITRLRTTVPTTMEVMGTATVVGTPTVVVHMATAKAEEVETAEKEQEAAKAAEMPHATVPADFPAVGTSTAAAKVIHLRQHMRPLGLPTGHLVL